MKSIGFIGWSLSDSPQKLHRYDVSVIPTPLSSNRRRYFDSTENNDHLPSLRNSLPYLSRYKQTIFPETVSKNLFSTNLSVKKLITFFIFLHLSPNRPVVCREYRTRRRCYISDTSETNRRSPHSQTTTSFFMTVCS